MPFSPNASVISTDLDNMLRGLYRDNSNTVLTGTVVETNLKLFSVPANTMGPTGGVHIIICGTLAGVAGTKTLRLKFGSSGTIETILQGAGTVTPWFIDAWCFNTATNAQRWYVQKNGNDLLTSTFDYTTTANDTTANQTILLTGQLGNAGDTITQTMMEIFVVQIN